RRRHAPDRPVDLLELATPHRWLRDAGRDRGAGFSPCGAEPRHPPVPGAGYPARGAGETRSGFVHAQFLSTPAGGESLRAEPVYAVVVGPADSHAVEPLHAPHAGL